MARAKILSTCLLVLFGLCLGILPGKARPALTKGIVEQAQSAPSNSAVLASRYLSGTARIPSPRLSAGLVFATTTHAPATASGETESDDEDIVVQPHAVVAGRTLGEWSASWWKWAYAFPTNDNPLLDTTGAKSHFGDVGDVFFLAGLFNIPSSSSVTRTATVPSHKFIFFPLDNFVNDNVGVSPRVTIDVLYAQLAAAIPGITALHASLDGVPINNLEAHREISPVFSYTLQVTDNLQQVVNGIHTPDAQGTVFPAAADGFYLMLRPLPPGPHVLNFGGTTFGTTLDVTYNLTVTTTRSVAPMVLVP